MLKVPLNRSLRCSARTTNSVTFLLLACCVTEAAAASIITSGSGAFRNLIARERHEKVQSPLNRKWIQSGFVGGNKWFVACWWAEPNDFWSFRFPWRQEKTEIFAPKMYKIRMWRKLQTKNRPSNCVECIDFNTFGIFSTIYSIYSNITLQLKINCYHCCLFCSESITRRDMRTERFWVCG